MNDNLAFKLIPPPLSQAEETSISFKNFHVWINDQHILKDLNLSFQKNAINCIIGPSGGGKSTLIRSINRINDETPGFASQGGLLFNNEDIYQKNYNNTELRSQVGMVFQKPCVFPCSIEENLLFGVRFQKKLSKRQRIEIVEQGLKDVALWSEVKHRLTDPATSLSLGQQQRLCLARSLALEPKVILLDEPTASLDPLSTRAIETLMLQLKEKYTIIFVTHNIAQAKRIADNLSFLCEGELVEQGTIKQIVNHAKDQRTVDYLSEKET